MAKLPERLMVRNGTYYCRVWVPKEIVPIFGRQVVIRSLRTQDLKTARSRLARRIVELEDRFDLIRKNRSDMDRSDDSLATTGATRDNFFEIARQHAISASDRAFADRADLFSQATQAPDLFWKGRFGALPTPADFGAGEDDAYTYYDHLVAEGDLEKVIAYVARFRLRKRIEAMRSARASGNLDAFVALADDRCPGLDGPDKVALARLMLEEELLALQAIADGKPDPSLEQLRAGGRAATNAVPATLPEGKISQPAPAVRSISLDELFDLWEAEANPSASTLSSWRGIARNLSAFLGAKANDIAEITPEDIIAWKDKLVKAKKSPATINRGYLGCARALFRFAVKNKKLASDPTEDVEVSGKAKPGTKMLGYTNEEAARLLDLARHAKEPWKRWLPWLAAATGSRIGEVAQLHGSHVFEQDGYTVLRIRPADDAGSIKNDESERTVPLHSALIEAGFLDFVAEKGDGPLFYSRSSGDPKRKHASKSVGSRLAKWIRENGFNEKRKAPNHALRHWFKTEASRLRIPDSVADAIQGHADNSASGVYRHVDVEQMSAAIEQIKLPPMTGKKVVARS